MQLPCKQAPKSKQVKCGIAKHIKLQYQRESLRALFDKIPAYSPNSARNLPRFPFQEFPFQSFLKIRDSPDSYPFSFSGKQRMKNQTVPGFPSCGGSILIEFPKAPSMTHNRYQSEALLKNIIQEVKQHDTLNSEARTL